MGTVQKTGFETRFTASGFYDSGVVEALGADGSILRRSLIRKTYVPGRMCRLIDWGTDLSTPSNRYLGSCEPTPESL